MPPNAALCVSWLQGRVSRCTDRSDHTSAFARADAAAAMRASIASAFACTAASASTSASRSSIRAYQSYPTRRTNKQLQTRLPTNRTVRSHYARLLFIGATASTQTHPTHGMAGETPLFAQQNKHGTKTNYKYGPAGSAPQSSHDPCASGAASSCPTRQACRCSSARTW